MFEIKIAVKLQMPALLGYHFQTLLIVGLTRDFMSEVVDHVSYRTISYYHQFIIHNLILTRTYEIRELAETLPRF